jgi:HSP20 family protein
MSLIRFKNQGRMPLWSDFFGNDEFFGKDLSSGSFPATNVEDSEKSFIIKLAIPGVEKKDINVELDGNVLVISSNKETSSEEEDKNYTLKEYNYSSFKRSFTLPENVVGENINANYENGELVVTLPKSVVEVAKTKSIKVA